jgi:hypothetical protein
MHEHADGNRRTGRSPGPHTPERSPWHAVSRGTAGPGRPLEALVRSEWESRLGQDLSRVRVHSDETAAALCADVSARAFTVGGDIYFGARSFEPRSLAGRELIGHELGHLGQPASAPEAERHEYRVADVTVRRATPDGGVVVPPFLPPAAGDGLNLPLLLAEQRDLVVSYVLPALFLEISHREVLRSDPDGTLTYEKGNRLTIRLSGKTSSDTAPFHCTDLVMNSAFLAGFEVLGGGTGYYLTTKRTLGRVLEQRPGDVVEQVPMPKDVAATPQDESKANLRPGDVMVWGPSSRDALGHTMIIVEAGDKAGKVTVREAGSSVHDLSRRPLRPDDRESAVYRFTTPNLGRIQDSYRTDPEYRRMFDAAFEMHFYDPGRGPRSDDPGRYRAVGPP